MDSNQILCIKIAQRRLRVTDMYYFPYDRVYLCSKENLPQVKKAFRYLLYTEIRNDFLQGLNDLPKFGTETVGKYRKVFSPESYALKEGIKNNSFDYMCMPTSVRTGYGKGNKHSLLYYKMSRQIKNRDNGYIEAIPLRIKTPDRDISLLCAVCSNVLEMHDGLCALGTSKCTQNGKIIFKHDGHHTTTRDAYLARKNRSPS